MNKRLTITLLFALLYITTWFTYNYGIQWGILALTSTAITGIIVFCITTLKMNNSMLTRFKILLTYFLGGTIAIIFNNIYTTIAVLFLFITIIIATNKIK